MKGMIDTVDVYKPGSQPPTGYNQWHEWARVQHAAGLRQKQCGICSLWKYPQELSVETVTMTGTTSKWGGRKVTITSPICKKCN